MLENEFERKVQQRMGEFRLRPSDAVWENVEHELRKKKKRRVVFYIFILAGLSLLGYSGYFFINQSKQNLVEQNSTPSQIEKGQTRHTPTTPAEKNEGNKTVTVPHPGNGNIETPVTKDELDPGKEDGQAILKRNEIVSNEDRHKKPVAGDEGKIREQIAGDRVANVKNKTAKRSRVAINENNKKIPGPVLAKTGNHKKNAERLPGVTGQENANDRHADKKDHTDKKDIAVTDPQVVEPKDKPQVPVVEDSAAGTVQHLPAIADGKNVNEDLAAVKKKRLKLNWGFDVSAGVSEVNKSSLPFSSSNQQNFDVYYSPLPITPGNAAYFPPLAPSSVQPGFAIKFGPAAEIELTKRSRVSFGVQYAYMSSKMKIGTYTNSSVVVNNPASQSQRVTAFYSGIYRQDYTNRYHFVQVPVAYHLQLNKGKKLPVTWTAGLSAGYLVATNGLLYDTAAGGIYYRDKKAFNKFRFNINTGIAFRIGNGQRMQWSIGPEVSLGMNKLVKDAYSGRQYLLYGGLAGRLIFSKKK